MSFHQGFLHQEGHIHVLWTGVTFFVSRRVVSFPLFFFLFFSFFNLMCPGPFFDELLSLICLTLQMLLPFTSIFVPLPICCV